MGAGINSLAGRMYVSFNTSMEGGDLYNRTPTQCTLRAGDANGAVAQSIDRVVVHGSGFTYAGPNHHLAAGEVVSLEVFHGTTLVGRVTNLFMNAVDFQSAVDNFHHGQPWFPAIFETFQGSSGNDVFIDNNFSNDLFGKGGNDTINGMGGDDFIDGGTGINHLHGGPGFDSFFFRTVHGIDIIDDFTTGVDSIELSRAAFGAGIGPVGPLAPGKIQFGVAAATHPGTRFFVQPDGDFYYDANGSGAGHAVLIGKFIHGHLPHAGDFDVIA